MSIQALSRHPGSVAAPQARLTPSLFPEDAHVMIYKPGRSAMTSGSARTREWKLRFQRRSPPYVEPLMGWTGGDDTLTQVELSFPSAEAAIAFARRHGISYTVYGPTGHNPNLDLASDNTEPGGSNSHRRHMRLEWVERTLGRDVIRKGLGPGPVPSTQYADPRKVLRDDNLSQQQKREVLHRWALDAYLAELALSNSGFGAEPSGLEEVIDALIELDEPVRPFRKAA